MFVRLKQNLTIIEMRALAVLILWCILLVMCWPLAVVVFIAFLLISLILIPFKIAFFSIGVLFKILGAILLFPFKVLGLA